MTGLRGFGNLCSIEDQSHVRCAYTRDCCVGVQDTVVILNREMCTVEDRCSYSLPWSVCAFKKKKKAITI